MLTITGIIRYAPKSKPVPRLSKTAKTSLPITAVKLTEAEKQRIRRAQAREAGFCGVCKCRRPSANLRTCDVCLGR